MLPTEALKRKAHSLGFELAGVCPIDAPVHWSEYGQWLDRGFAGTMDYLQQHLAMKRDPRSLLATAKSIVAVGLNYNQDNPAEPGSPHFARYARGRDYHKVVRGKLRRLADWLDGEHPGGDHRACVDSAPILERDYANSAGLGWFGKNTMLINSQRGSWFFIGLLLTSLEFEPDSPAIGGCGSCRACIDACPTGAIVNTEGRWQVDARRCISYLTIEHRGEIEPELASQMGGWTFGCDVCQEVCPFNQPRESQPIRALETQEPDFLKLRMWPPLAEVAEIDDVRWDELTQGSPIRRTGLEGIRRNARINLKNGRS